jgi:hypothetical protein
LGQGVKKRTYKNKNCMIRLQNVRKEDIYGKRVAANNMERPNRWWKTDFEAGTGVKLPTPLRYVILNVFKTSARFAFVVSCCAS